MFDVPTRVIVQAPRNQNRRGGHGRCPKGLFSTVTCQKMPREAKTIEDTCHHSSVLQQWPRPLEAGPDRPPPQRQQHHSTSRLLLCKRGTCVRSSPVDRPGHCPRRQVNSSVAQHIHLLTSTREAGPDRPPPVSPPTARRRIPGLVYLGPCAQCIQWLCRLYAPQGHISRLAVCSVCWTGASCVSSLVLVMRGAS